MTYTRTSLKSNFAAGIGLGLADLSNASPIGYSTLVVGCTMV